MSHPDIPPTGHVVNPEAVGDPDQIPIVQLDPEEAAWLTAPANGGCAECHGVNWFHEPNCTVESSQR